MQGKSYVRSSGQRVPGRRFEPVQNCCRRRCHERINEDSQRVLFTDFWKLSDYEPQNVFLSGLMSSTPVQSMYIAPIRANRGKNWHYKLKEKGIETVVCKQFFHLVFKVNIMRTRVLQDKLSSGIPLRSWRGCHDNRPQKTSQEVWVLLKLYCNSLPHRNSHYTSSARKYFENPLLNMSILYSAFLEYY